MTDEQMKVYMADVKARFEQLEATVKAIETFLVRLGHTPSK